MIVLRLESVPESPGGLIQTKLAGSLPVSDLGRA